MICTFTFEAGAKGFRTMMGVRPDRAARETIAAGAHIVGANITGGCCGTTSVHIAAMARAVRALAAEA